MSSATPLANDELDDVPTVAEAYKTWLGTMYQGKIEEFLDLYGDKWLYELERGSGSSR